MSDLKETVEVTQADREEAAALLAELPNSFGSTSHVAEQAFARHRIAAIEQLETENAKLVEGLENLCLAAEYWAGCDEGCDADSASSEIMSSGGAWPAEAYDKARALITKARHVEGDRDGE